MSKKQRKVSLISGITVVLLLSILFLCRSLFIDKAVDAENLPISYLHADFLVDTDNPREVVGAADYYFVAKIDQVVGTTYKNPVTIETENGHKEVADPYTNYKITVTENIKGNLNTDSPIEIVKAGGIAQDKKSILLYENDTLLEVGQSYIITAFAQHDGSLLIAGPNSSERITSAKMSKNDYKQYYEEEVEVTRERYSSKYDQ